MAMRYVALRRNSYRSRRSKGQPSARFRASIHGHVLGVDGRHCRRPSALRSGHHALRSCRNRALATRVGQDGGVLILCQRSMALWLLGYPDAALADAKQALQEARDISQATTLMFALFWTSLTQIFCGNFATATKEHDELIALADEKGSLFWKAYCTSMQGCLFGLTGKASDAVQKINAGIAACRSTGASVLTPLSLSYLAKAYAELGQFDDAWRCIGEAINGGGYDKGKMVRSRHSSHGGANRTEVARTGRHDSTKAILSGRSMSLAATSQILGTPRRHEPRTPLARPGQGAASARTVAPVYGWFTEGFDTRDLKEAKALLEELA